MANIIAIDQSLTCTGIVVMSEDAEVLFYGTYQTKPNKELDVFTDYKNRCSSLLNYLDTLVQQYNVKHIICESPSFASVGNATRTLSWLFGAIWEHFPNLEHITPSKLKKFATGKGNAKKEEMYEALESMGVCLRHIPKTKGRYDITDAWFLAYYKQQELLNENPNCN